MNWLEKFTPGYWISLVLSALLLAGVVLGIYSYGKRVGRHQCELATAKADAQAIATQSAQNAEATAAQGKAEVRIVTQYKDRIREVEKYVPTPHQAGACPADDQFVRLYNDQ